MEQKYDTLSLDALTQSLQTSLTEGLNEAQVLERQKQYGKNEIDERKGKHLIQKFIDQIGDFMILTLLGAAILSLLLGEQGEALLIIAIVLLNATLGIVQESKAEKALEAIKKMTSPQAKVIRNGKLQVIPASELVVGDIVELQTGDFVPADLRLFEVHQLQVDESALTGESVPVEKRVEFDSTKDSNIVDSVHCAFMGTAVTYGNGKGIVIGTGMATEIGKIAKLINDVETIQTPIQKNLERLGKLLLIIISIICGIIFFAGIIQGQDYFDMFITVVSLAVAAIPEGLPAIVTIVFAIGMQRLARQNALIRKLPAVETLGSTHVICTDKTGTLTQNEMTVTHVYTNHTLYPKENWHDPHVRRLAVLATLCNNTRVYIENHSYQKVGDPTEVALINLALEGDLDPIQTIQAYPRLDELPFDSKRKRMTTVHQMNGKKVIIMKGAPEVVLSACVKIQEDNQVLILTDWHKNRIMKANDDMTNHALRVIAFAYKVIPEKEHISPKKYERDLVFLGLIGMIDPPREEAYEAIRLCQQAGIETVMITGDHKNTAIAIAKELNILNPDDLVLTGYELDQLTDEELKRAIDRIKVYARVTPEHKLRIVQAWQAKGKIVAMTGDGVNDAPALKNADIGIAMGIQGTEVAKGAADMVLTDDNFATIVKAVKEGRTIFANIKKAVKFLISCNIGEVITILLGAMIGPILYGLAVTPLTAVQLLWANLVTDSLIAIAIAMEKSEPDIMTKRPKKETLLDFEAILVILFQGLLIGFLSFTAFHFGYRMGTDHASSLLYGQTMAFMTLSIAELFHAFNVRSEQYSIFEIGLFSNPYVIVAFIISLALQLSTLIHPFTRRLFRVTPLKSQQFVIVFILSIVPIFVVEIAKLFGKKPAEQTKGISLHQTPINK